MTGSTTTDTSATSIRARQVRLRLAEICTASLNSLIPQPDSRARGVWNDDSIRTLTAIFELQRVEIHSEWEERRIDNHLIARIIDCLTTTTFFPDPCAPNLILEMEAHLRLLASALRTYKYHGKSLEQTLHDAIYDGINSLWGTIGNARSQRNETVHVEDNDVAYLLKHCQYLLVSIDGSDSFARKVSKRAIILLDTAVAGAGQQYQELRPGLLRILKRQRDRPKWHHELVRLEDGCSGVFAGDLRLRDSSPSEILVDEAISAIDLLAESMEYHYQNPQHEGRVTNHMRRLIGIATNVVNSSGPYEENCDHLRYGILDLLGQLAIRIPKASRCICFDEMLRIVRMVLERSPRSSKSLYLKATDLWNRILDFGQKDDLAYGIEEDRQAIFDWINQHRGDVESSECSKRYP